MLKDPALACHYVFVPTAWILFIYNSYIFVPHWDLQDSLEICLSSHFRRLESTISLQIWGSKKLLLFFLLVFEFSSSGMICKCKHHYFPNFWQTALSIQVWYSGDGNWCSLSLLQLSPLQFTSLSANDYISSWTAAPCVQALLYCSSLYFHLILSIAFSITSHIFLYICTFL